MTKTQRVALIGAIILTISIGEFFVLVELFELRRSAVIRGLESELKEERIRTASLLKLQSAIRGAGEHRKRYLETLVVPDRSNFAATRFAHVENVNEEIRVSFEHIDSGAGDTYYSIYVYLRADLSLARIVHESVSE